MAAKTVLILGGGVGGIVTANALRQRLAAEHRIVVVDKNAEYVFTPSLLWLMVGWRRPEQITRPLRRLLRPGVDVVQGAVEEIDSTQSRVRVHGQSLPYDYLVVALGADLAPESLPGYTEAAHNFFALDGAAGLWQALQRLESGRVAVLVSAMPYKCPAAPYEAAMLLDDALRRRGIRGRCRIEIFTPEPLPMPVAGQAVGEAVVGMLASKGIVFHPARQVGKIDPEARELVFRDGTREPYDFLAAVPPHRPPSVLQGSPLVNEAGWVVVDKHTLRTRAENVSAIGDVAAIRLANGKPLPKAGVFAHGQAETVAARIAAEIKRDPTQARFDGTGYCWIETGDGSAGFASGHFYAEPDPAVPLPRSGRLWHMGKVLFEQYWLGEGLRRETARLGLNVGSRLLGIPASL
ncbi:MAG: NAD(P)/FAD-dependent oxidoreductase [Ardenticatenaceae bacterium]|nr:NAD(P)/FAD-dependent oxidoreductase [Ardenticatenaceae bacterium]HBY99664.1 pyridine nucleotide-disulfide oxidoreductase [Chloroflexota bacterium]